MNQLAQQLEAGCRGQVVARKYHLPMPYATNSASSAPQTTIQVYSAHIVYHRYKSPLFDRLAEGQAQRERKASGMYIFLIKNCRGRWRLFKFELIIPSASSPFVIRACDALPLRANLRLKRRRVLRTHYVSTYREV
jgi:hypothetical protein